MSAVLALAVLTPLIASTPAFATSRVHGAIEQGDGCTLARTIKMGNAAIARNGTHVHVSVNGGLPAGDNFVIQIWAGPTSSCFQVGSDSPTFSANAADYFQASATFSVPRRITKFFVDVVDTTAFQDNETGYLRVLP
jgi:hypothetical protein